MEKFIILKRKLKKIKLKYLENIKISVQLKTNLQLAMCSAFYKLCDVALLVSPQIEFAVANPVI